MRLRGLLLIPLLLLGCAKKGTKSNQSPPPTPPPEVSLYPPAHITGRSLLLAWSPYLGADFSSYRLYRSTTAQVDTISQLLVVDTLRYDTTFCDTGLTEETRYYYRLYLFSSDTLPRPSDPTWGLAQGGDYCFYLRMGESEGSAGGEVAIPLTLQSCAPLGGFSLLLSWEKGPVDSARIEGWPYWVGGKRYQLAYFQVNTQEIGDSLRSRLVGFCQAIGQDNPPWPPSQEPDTLALLTFWLSPHWDHQPIPIQFLTEKPGYDNTITDPTGSSLYCASPDCPQNTCPPNPAIDLRNGQITAEP